MKLKSYLLQQTVNTSKHCTKLGRQPGEGGALGEVKPRLMDS